MLEPEALVELRRVKDSYQNFIRENFEFAAQDCGACPTFGACCLDAHFVNVHITRLEAVAIQTTLEQKLNADRQRAVGQRVLETIEKYQLTGAGETFAQTFACPLFEPKVGCLVHREAKPAPCIQHACYELQGNLPPACLQDRAESRIEKLNRAVYGDDWRWLPLPIWLMRVAATEGE